MPPAIIILDDMAAAQKAAANPSKARISLFVDVNLHIGFFYLIWQTSRSLPVRMFRGNDACLQPGAMALSKA
jgi:hypothetical protein